MIAFSFLHAASSEDFKDTAITGLVSLAERLLWEKDRLALHMLVGALARLEPTYQIPLKLTPDLDESLLQHACLQRMLFHHFRRFP